MTARTHWLWVQELLASRGLDVAVDDSRIADGVYTFTSGARSTTRTFDEMRNTPVPALADQLQVELTS